MTTLTEQDALEVFRHLLSTGQLDQHLDKVATESASRLRSVRMARTQRSFPIGARVQVNSLAATKFTQGARGRVTGYEGRKWVLVKFDHALGGRFGYDETRPLKMAAPILDLIAE